MAATLAARSHSSESLSNRPCRSNSTSSSACPPSAVTSIAAAPVLSPVRIRTARHSTAALHRATQLRRPIPSPASSLRSQRTEPPPPPPSQRCLCCALPADCRTAASPRVSLSASCRAAPPCLPPLWSPLRILRIRTRAKQSARPPPPPRMRPLTLTLVLEWATGERGARRACQY